MSGPGLENQQALADVTAAKTPFTSLLLKENEAATTAIQPAVTTFL